MIQQPLIASVESLTRCAQSDNERNIGALPMIEVINGLDEMELLEFYLAITEVDEREIFIIIDRIKTQKGVDLPF